MCLVVDRTTALRIFALGLVSLLFVTDARADKSKLTVTPNKCVALREGQTCYQSLRITFVTSTIGDYCLRVVEQPAPLQCWSSIDSAQYRYPLASKSSIDFEVVNSEQVQVAVSRITITWVHKKTRRRSRWRIF